MIKESIDSLTVERSSKKSLTDIRLAPWELIEQVLKHKHLTREYILSLNPLTDDRTLLYAESYEYFYPISIGSNWIILRGINIIGEGYLFKLLRCWHCSRVIFCMNISKRYCSYVCSRDAYLARRRKRNEDARVKQCMYCKKVFKAKRRDARYCCESHRVLACIYRKSRAGYY